MKARIMSYINSGFKSGKLWRAVDKIIGLTGFFISKKCYIFLKLTYIAARCNKVCGIYSFFKFTQRRKECKGRFFLQRLAIVQTIEHPRTIQRTILPNPYPSVLVTLSTPGIAERVAMRWSNWLVLKTETLILPS